MSGTSASSSSVSSTATCPQGQQPCGTGCAPADAQCCGNAYCLSGQLCFQSEITLGVTQGGCIANPESTRASGSPISTVPVFITLTSDGSTIVQSVGLTTLYNTSRSSSSVTSSILQTTTVSYSPPSNSSVKSSNGLSGGAIAGTVIGSITGFVVIVAGAFLLYKRNHKPKQEPNDTKAVEETSYVPYGGRHELSPDERTEINELEGSSPNESGGNALFEIDSIARPVEAMSSTD